MKRMTQGILTIALLGACGGSSSRDSGQVTLSWDLKSVTGVAPVSGDYVRSFQSVACIDGDAIQVVTTDLDNPGLPPLTDNFACDLDGDGTPDAQTTAGFYLGNYESVVVLTGAGGLVAQSLPFQFTLDQDGQNLDVGVIEVPVDSAFGNIQWTFIDNGSAGSCADAQAVNGAIDQVFLSSYLDSGTPGVPGDDVEYGDFWPCALGEGTTAHLPLGNYEDVEGFLIDGPPSTGSGIYYSNGGGGEVVGDVAVPVSQAGAIIPFGSSVIQFDTQFVLDL